MKLNDQVRIYQKPLSEEDYEGEAHVRYIVKDDGWWDGRKVLRCRVEFVKEPGHLYERVVLIPKVEE